MRHEQRFTAKKIARRLELLNSLVYRKKSPLPALALKYLPSPQAPLPLNEDIDQWERLSPFSYWANMRQDFILRQSFTVPPDFDTENVALYFPLGEPDDFSHPEALLYIDGEAIASIDRHHQEIKLSPRFADGQAHDFALHGWSGQHNRDGQHGRLFARESAIVEIHQPTRDFIRLATVALESANTLAEDQPSKYRLLNALEIAFKILDLREPFGDDSYASIMHAYELLQHTIKEQAGSALDVEIVCAGHAHIDLAWLWRTEQTRQKGRRTFYTVLHLMEQFPAYRFTQSQPQLYEWIREDDPALFAKITEKVKEGRWEPIGGMWVEADCNVPGSEALVRQFLYGQQWFQEHFGGDIAAPVLWLPDVFGYSWALPQILKKCGIDYFMTIKIGWSQYNRLPYDSFWWQGMDGSRVLTHFSTVPDPWSDHASTYNAIVTPEQSLGTWRNFKQKELTHPLLMAYGYGDGGGGPTREMLENIETMGDFPAMPRLRQSSVLSFFQEMEAAEKADRENGLLWPTWNGELYLEYHRATYTTQARTKRGNRQCEIALHNLEFLATWAQMVDENYSYPYDTLRTLWRKLLLNQFHDILPGSSIGAVYVDAEKDYADILAETQSLQKDAISILAPHFTGDILVINPTATDIYTPFTMTYPKPLPEDKTIKHVFGSQVSTQESQELGTFFSHNRNNTIRGYSISGFSIVDKQGTDNITPLIVEKDRLENDWLCVELNTDGDITSIRFKSPYPDGEDDELLTPGTIGNQFIAYDDRPNDWDAWDVDIAYDDIFWLAEPATSIEVIERGPLRATIEIKRRILNSSYTQRISLDRDMGITFDTEIDWQEKHKLLKVRFPTNIRATTATHEIQWGYVERPTHQNTSWDWAKFETPAQRWVALREGYRSTALISDSKYGYAVHDGVLAMSLLRGSTWPDPEADQGQQQFRYMLRLTQDDSLASIIYDAMIFNNPPIIVDVAELKKHEEASKITKSLLLTDDSEFVIETIKMAEDNNGIIVRAYDISREHRINQLSTSFTVAEAWLCDMLENNLSPLPINKNGQVLVKNAPHEIITLRLVPMR